MDRTEARWKPGGKAIAVIALSAWSAAAAAQLLGNISSPTATEPTPSGQAAAARSYVLGQSTSLADSGTLSGAGDARDASQLSGDIPGVLKGGVLHAVTIGWSDQAASEASMADVAISVGGVGVSADFVMARAMAVAGAAASGRTLVENLSINGVPISVTGEANQSVAIPGGRVVVNEQTASTGGMAVNALRVVVDGVADVVVGSANAAIR
jgi:hypothetical protein